MTTEGGEEMHKKTGEEESRKEDEEIEAEKEEDESDSESSPRGVLEIPTTGSDSDTSLEGVPEIAITGSDSDTSLEGEKPWKKLLGRLRRKSSMKFSTIPLWGGYGFKKKLGRLHSAGEAINCGDSELPKPSWRNFTFQQLSMATHDFSPENLIGKGGHAEVYKGFLPDGQVVAVKKIIKEKKNNEDRVGDFLSELGIIAHIDHPNTAKLIGFSAEGGLHLVLQFSPHGNLATVLHGGCEESMGWNTRYKVAIGVAEGLEYLHCGSQRRIIHRDITASNILLSEDYEAQISDFGLAKWLPEKWLHHVVSPIEGTFGYMAPEYFMHGVVHEKTDVFAFGVLLLELITGRRAVDSSRQSIVMWAKQYLEHNDIEAMADPKLGQDYNVTDMKRAMFTASICIHHQPNTRPSMTRVVKLLKGENEAVETKQKPMGTKAFLWEGCDLEDYSSTTYLKDLNRHMELVME